MSDPDDSFEMEIERVNSEENKSYDKVPENTLFMFKFKSEKSKTYEFLIKPLGKTVSFSRFLKPVFENMDLVCSEKNILTFQDSGRRES